MEAEAFFVSSGAEGAAAWETRGGSPEGSSARKLGVTVGALVEVFSSDLPAWERQVVAAGFVLESEVAASLLPFDAMRGDFASACAVLCDEVGQFVKEGAVDFAFAELAQSRVEDNLSQGGVGEACGAAHSGVPEHLKGCGEGVKAEFGQLLLSAEGQVVGRFSFEGSLLAHGGGGGGQEGFEAFGKGKRQFHSRSRSQTRPTVTTVWSISASVRVRHKENRRERFARAGEIPMAIRTWEGCRDPTIHAEPLEAQIPSISSAMRRLSESELGKVTLVVLGRRCWGVPFTTSPGQRSSNPVSSRFRSCARRGESSARREAASVAATDRPTMAGVFSVPPRR